MIYLKPRRRDRVNVGAPRLASAALKWTAGITRDIIPSDQALLKLIDSLLNGDRNIELDSHYPDQRGRRPTQGSDQVAI
jgi:hypothetical protein